MKKLIVTVVVVLALGLAGAALAYSSKVRVACPKGVTAAGRWSVAGSGIYNMKVTRLRDGFRWTTTEDWFHCYDQSGCVSPLLFADGYPGERIMALTLVGPHDMGVVSAGCEASP